jgi:hypothetical protein
MCHYYATAGARSARAAFAAEGQTEAARDAPGIIGDESPAVLPRAGISRGPSCGVVGSRGRRFVMIELRLLGIIGLLATMAVVVATVVGVLAVARWLRRVGQDLLHRHAGENATSRTTFPRATAPMLAEAERRVRLRQAAWRLRC